MDPKPAAFEENWRYLDEGIMKLKKISEDHPEPQLRAEEFMMLYTVVYNMCTNTPPFLYNDKLYEKYKVEIEDYIAINVIPSLEELHGQHMLKEVVKRWKMYKVYVKRLSHIFRILDSYHVCRWSLPTLNEIGCKYFLDMVIKLKKLYGEMKDVIISLINQEREGQQIDRDFLKNLIDIFVDADVERERVYDIEFEAHLLIDTAAYYSQRASDWILNDSCPDYMIKAEDCLQKERDRASHYLHSRTKPKLLEKVKNELLVVFASQLIEKENSGCRVLLREEKVEDLSRMFRLYQDIPKAMELIVDIFKQHIISEVTTLIQQSVEAVNTQASNSPLLQEKEFLNNIHELQNKNNMVVSDCFANHTMFSKVVKEASEEACKKYIARSCPYAEAIMSVFCVEVEPIEETTNEDPKKLIPVTKKGEVSCKSDIAREAFAEELPLFPRARNGVEINEETTDEVLKEARNVEKIIDETTNNEKVKIEKENSGCRVLLREQKVEDLSRMSRLYQDIPKGLELIADISKQGRLEDEFEVYCNMQDTTDEKLDAEQSED